MCGWVRHADSSGAPRAERQAAAPPPARAIDRIACAHVAGLWVSLTSIASARVAPFDASRDVHVAAELASHFPVGTPVQGTISRIERRAVRNERGEIEGEMDGDDDGHASAHVRLSLSLRDGEQAEDEEEGEEEGEEEEEEEEGGEDEEEEEREEAPSKRARNGPSGAELPTVGSVLPVRVVRARAGRGLDVQLGEVRVVVELLLL